MALKGQKIEDIQEVHSSDGIITMYGFLEKISNIKLVEDKDTAETKKNSRKTTERNSNASKKQLQNV
jgi:hypothetical protein